MNKLFTDSSNFYLLTFIYSHLFIKIRSIINKKSPRSTGGIIYMDGLVSTGNKFPDTILKIILAIQKIFLIFFIHILNIVVDKQHLLCLIL
jgi:hypothetical protein